MFSVLIQYRSVTDAQTDRQTELCCLHEWMWTHDKNRLSSEHNSDGLSRKIASCCNICMVFKPLNLNNLHILLVFSHHIDSRVSWGHLRLTCCQHSLHRQTWLLVGSHAAPPPFGTVFHHSYALLIASLVLGLSSRLTFSQDICSRSTVRASETLKPVFRAL